MLNSNNPPLEISEFAQAVEGACLDNSIAVVKIDSLNIGKFNIAVEDMLLTQSRNNVIILFFVCSGELNFTLDYIKYRIKERGNISVTALNIFTQFQASKDYQGYMLLTTKNYFDEAFLEKKPITIQQLLSTPKVKGYEFTPTDFSILRRSLDQIYTSIKRESHRFRRELVRNTFCNFVLEGANIRFANESTEEEIKTDRNTDSFVNKFVDLLVEYGDKEHNPAFYADKLCISVQYLSLLLKRASGETANGWIAGYLINRAKVMLRKQDYTIQQITYMLNFSDQSAFGKFFKKHTGSTPKKYRDEHSVYS